MTGRPSETMGTGVPADAVTVNFDPGAKDAEAQMNCAFLWPFTATECRNFITYDGKLFVGTGVWMDEVTPYVGPAIMVLKSGYDAFEIEHQFTSRETAVCLLHVAHFERPVEYTVPIASTWHGQDFVDLLFRDYHNSSWHHAQNISKNPPGEGASQIRCAFNYTDPTVDTSYLFLGEAPNGVFSIKHDPDARGGLAQAVLELPCASLPLNEGAKQNRVMSFGVVRGKLYASIHNRLYERQNGPHPSWRMVHEDLEVGQSESGFRGLTTVGGDMSGTGYFFVAREGQNPAILKLMPPAASDGSWTQTVEYDLSARLSEAWTEFYGGPVDATSGIAAYNNMVWFQPHGPQGKWALFVGFEMHVGRHPDSMPVIEHNNYYLHALGCYLVWNFEGKGEWRLCHLPPVTSQPMVSCRAGCVNPWGGPRFYIGGYDCNYEPSHNSGWVVSLDMNRMLEGAIA